MTWSTTESGERYAPDTIPTPPSYNSPQTNANPESAPYRRTKTCTSASPTDLGDAQQVSFYYYNKLSYFSTSERPNDDDERVPAANAGTGNPDECGPALAMFLCFCFCFLLTTIEKDDGSRQHDEEPKHGRSRTAG